MKVPQRPYTPEIDDQLLMCEWERGIYVGVGERWLHKKNRQMYNVTFVSESLNRVELVNVEDVSDKWYGAVQPLVHNFARLNRCH